MRKQLFKTAVATATALSIAVMPALTVCAEDVTESIVLDGETREIDGNVNINMDDQGPEYGIEINHGGELTVNGDVTISKTDKYVPYPIYVSEGSSLWIKGDYSYQEYGDNHAYMSLSSSRGSTVIIDGNVEGVKGIYAGNSNLYVGGDIKTEDYGVSVRGWDYSDKNVVIEGTIKEYNRAAISVEGYVYEDQTIQDLLDELPKMAVYAVEERADSDLVTTYHVNFDDYSLSEEKKVELRQEAAELFAAALNYIIHTEGGEISFSGDDLLTAADFGIDDPNKNFTTTKFGKTFTATVGSNYALEGNESVEVTKISDGVYSVKLIDRKGGILLTATALSSGQDQPLVIVVPDSKESSSSESQSSSSESSAASYSDIPAGAVTVSLARSSAPTAAAGAGPAVLGATREPSRSVAIRVGQLTGAQFKQTIINNINATPAGGMLRIETDKIACFDKAMLEAFAKKGNIDMEVVFPIGNQKMNVTIPAGYDVSKLLDKKGYCGFLNLLAVFGTETEE